MITLIIAAIENSQFMEYIGYVLVACEALLVLIQLLQKFVEPESKFGRFLSKALKGIKFVKSATTEIADKIDKKEEKENDKIQNQDTTVCGSSTDENDTGSGT